MTQALETLLSGFAPISLQEMESVRLMNRIDTKFVTSTHRLMELIPLLQNDYKAQQINEHFVSEYHTLYFDTEDNSMYIRHHNGYKFRQKVRMREYIDTDAFFLEVKRKNNKGRTKKKRIPIDSMEQFNKIEADEFLKQESWFSLDELSPHLENRFMRTTLVNNEGTERLTIDTSLQFHNCISGEDKVMEGLVIIELKQDGNVPSFVRPILRDLRIFPTSFSKYCMGSALTNRELKQNLFKRKLIRINKLINS